MLERDTLVPTPHVPVVLAVGSTGAILARCRDAATAVGVDLEPVALVSLARAAATMRPVALLISADVYGFDPGEFDALALSVGAARVLVEAREPVSALAARLARALDEGLPAAAEPRAASGAPPRRTSGIRWRTAEQRRCA
jgi:hypothetical protein